MPAQARTHARIFEIAVGATSASRIPAFAGMTLERFMAAANVALADQPLKRGLRLARNASTPSLNSALPKAIACETASRSKKSSTLAS
jgi:hypothetical protein